MTTACSCVTWTKSWTTWWPSCAGTLIRRCFSFSALAPVSTTSPAFSESNFLSSPMSFSALLQVTLLGLRILFYILIISNDNYSESSTHWKFFFTSFSFLHSCLISPIDFVIQASTTDSCQAFKYWQFMARRATGARSLKNSVSWTSLCFFFFFKSTSTPRSPAVHNIFRSR